MKKLMNSYAFQMQQDHGCCAADPVFFKFEADFAEDGIRCIPMIVRFKLDACGIKLKLNEWGKFTAGERTILSEMDCSTKMKLLAYRDFLRRLILLRTGNSATDLPVEEEPAWSNKYVLPVIVLEKLDEFGWTISLQQWQSLSDLQRFVLLKLCRPGHENRNFPIAIKEFDLID
jgi:hypothetical protein